MDSINWRFPDRRTKFSTKYAEYLRSAHWALLKLNTIIARGMRCERCASLKDIDLHHLTYQRLGRELPQDVLLLCRMCHTKEHLVSSEERLWLYQWLFDRRKSPARATSATQVILTSRPRDRAQRSRERE
jgi:hypothetical protein